MNRQLPIAVLVLAFAARAQAPQAFTIEESLSVRVPVRVRVESTLTAVLATQSVADALRTAFVAALPKEAQPVHCETPNFAVTVIDPEAHALVSIFFAGTAATRLQRSEATTEAVANFLRQRLDTLLVEPAIADCNRELEILDRRLTQHQKSLAAAEERDASLGTEADGAPDAAVAELRQRALQHEVEERTEQDVANGLRERLADAQKQLDAAEEQLRSALAMVTMNEQQLADPAAQKDLGSIRVLLDSLRMQARKAETERTRAAEATAVLQQQLVVNAENTHRLAAARQNLQAILRKCESDAEAARGTRFQRTALRREIAACERDIVALQQAAAEAQRRRDALRSVEVRSWQ